MEGEDRTVTPAGPQGGDRALDSHQAAEIIHDATIRFCDRFIIRRSHTAVQMVEAARSGRRILAEQRQATSRQAGQTLLAPARACLEELRQVYEDFLSLRGLPLWGEEHPQAEAIRVLASGSDRSYGTFRACVEFGSPE
jgi:hypothetical protein